MTSGSFLNKKVRHLLSKRVNGKFFSSEMEDSDSESEFLTPRQIRDDAEETKRNLLPTKSKKKCEGEYLTYKLWKEQNLVKQTSENVLFAYFSELSQTKKHSTLWAIFSMLKSTIDVIEKVKIGIFTKVISFLKKQKKRLPEQKGKSFHGSRNKRVLGVGSK